MARINPGISRFHFPGLWIYLVILLALAGFGAWAVRVEQDFSFYWRDPAAIMGTSPWIGLFSNIGIFIWWMAAVVSVFTAIVIWRMPAQRRVAWFLLSWGMLTGVLALDDFFMIHEWLLPTYLPVTEDALIGVYFLVTAGLLLAFRSEILDTQYPVLVLALGLFGASNVIDLIGPARFQDWGLPVRLVWNLEYIVEDGFKLAGLIAWLHYFGLTCFLILREAVQPATDVNSVETTRERVKVG